MSELLNCPCCNGGADFEYDDFSWTFIKCGSCGLGTDHMDSYAEDCRPVLAEKWNRRAQPAQSAIDIEVLNENKALRGFAQEIMQAWPAGDIDGRDLQDAAERHGLLKLEVRHERCGDDCECATSCGEWPVDCYRKTALLAGAIERQG